MHLIIDECVDRQITECLKNDGHKVLYIGDMSKSMPDNEVLKLANQHNAVLLTLDKDFGELVYRKKYLTAGIILIRLSGMPNIEKAKIVQTVISKYSDKLMNSFSVISRKSVRIRNIHYLH